VGSPQTGQENRERMAVLGGYLRCEKEEPFMSNERIPNDPYRAGLEDPSLRGRVLEGVDRSVSSEQYREPPPRFDEELQIDPELSEGPAGAGKMALFAVCIALVLGAVFYGLNNSSPNLASTAPPAQTAQTQPAAPQAPPGVRDVTPKTDDQPNTQPGMTTGAAPDRK
jgi:hypothetical protein